MDAQEPWSSRRSRTMRRKLMWNARQQWKLLGLFEIGKQHEFYEFTCMLKEGLAAAVQNSIDNPPPVGNARHPLPFHDACSIVSASYCKYTNAALQF